MLSLVAGVCEEVGVRGYLQKPLEEAGFPVAAVAWSAAVFVLLHGDREWFAPQAGPMFAAALWYGWYTLRAGSIYPMVALHAVLDLGAFGYLWVLGGEPPGSVHRGGFTPWFWANLAFAVAALVLAVALTARIPKRRADDATEPGPAAARDAPRAGAP
jgi:hypothetical protein